MSRKDSMRRELERQEWEEMMRKDRARRDGVDLSKERTSGSVTDFSNAINRLVSQIEELEFKHDNLVYRVEALESLVEDLQSENENLSRKLKNSKSYLSDLDTTLSNSAKKIQEIEKYRDLDIFIQSCKSNGLDTFDTINEIRTKSDMFFSCLNFESQLVLSFIERVIHRIGSEVTLDSKKIYAVHNVLGEDFDLSVVDRRIRNILDE
jgi:chromosome segregation ATPase